MNENEMVAFGSADYGGERGLVTRELLVKVGESIELRGRVERLEGDVKELAKIVKGENEDEGLLYHVTRMRTGLSLIHLELAGLAGLIVAACAVLALLRK